MRQIYSPNSPFANFYEQTHVTTKQEFGVNWGKTAAEIGTRDQLLSHLHRHPGNHAELLRKFYSEANAILALGAGDAISPIFTASSPACREPCWRKWFSSTADRSANAVPNRQVRRPSFSSRVEPRGSARCI